MFTARSEYRLLLREDNADLRLSKIGYEVGLVSEEEYQRVEQKRENVKKIIEALQQNFVGPGNPRVNERLHEKGEQILKDGASLFEVLRRPEINYEDIEYMTEGTKVFNFGAYDEDTKYQVEVQTKYSGYVESSLKMIEKNKSMEQKRIPEDMDYDSLQNIPKEAKEKLKKIKPSNIGQASRISGVSPADIQVLLLYLKMRGN